MNRVVNQDMDYINSKYIKFTLKIIIIIIIKTIFGLFKINIKQLNQVWIRRLSQKGEYFQNQTKKNLYLILQHKKTCQIQHKIKKIHSKLYSHHLSKYQEVLSFRKKQRKLRRQLSQHQHIQQGQNQQFFLDKIYKINQKPLLILNLQNLGMFRQHIHLMKSAPNLNLMAKLEVQDILEYTCKSIQIHMQFSYLQQRCRLLKAKKSIILKSYFAFNWLNLLKVFIL
ncbi:transmembrane protein, putative (macronuclear) [Tetrahymena thermophila SB210]|uniref:Transmembrane protein, putative n=1 Tax=Tetrahymena thermophila (strain SB210) TaxID=312017 RepID=W7X9Z5_TETTS|nr:transmembrane protein, putative [Tetrahymena thermophila SB210]EWS73218.1 transmembrane protein, putative [Tetrahymena thermophila SB210]|eukprot:XP_012654250.1 transmembrane protein, putative [Tetrahymena thermophila SB210]